MFLCGLKYDRLIDDEHSFLGEPGTGALHDVEASTPNDGSGIWYWEFGVKPVRPWGSYMGVSSTTDGCHKACAKKYEQPGGFH